MGYFIASKAEDNRFVVRSAKFAECVERIADVVPRGSGAVYQDGKCVLRSLAFTEIDSPEKARSMSLSDILQEMGWEPVVDSVGDVITLSFDENKMGDESLVFEAVAPCVEPGSYICVRGEGGHRWRYVFDGKSMTKEDLQRTQ